MRRRYNVAPGDDVLAVVQQAAGALPEGTLLRWGLVPSWASDPKELGARTINARAETIAERRLTATRSRTAAASSSPTASTGGRAASRTGSRAPATSRSRSPGCGLRGGVNDARQGAPDCLDPPEQPARF